MAWYINSFLTSFDKNVKAFFFFPLLSSLRWNQLTESVQQLISVSLILFNVYHLRWPVRTKQSHKTYNTNTNLKQNQKIRNTNTKLKT